MEKRIKSLIADMKRRKIKITVNNVVVQSLFSAGGTITDKGLINKIINDLK